MTAAVVATTVGTLLGGRVRYEQPVGGYRTGIEPVFLAAAVPARPGEHVLEGGTGAGAGLLCLATRVPGLTGLGVERDEAMAELARRNLAGLPGLSVRAGAIEGLPDGRPFDHAFANPPWHGPGTSSPDRARQAALQTQDRDTLEVWCRSLLRHLRAGGTLTLVLAARLAEPATRALQAAGAGRVLDRTLVPKQGRAPKIVLIHATAQAPAERASLPALVLHREDGRYTAETEAVLRDGVALSWTG